MRQRLSSEGGQDTVEWGGLLAIVALVIGALFALGVPASVASGFECNVNKILTGAGGCAPTAVGPSANAGAPPSQGPGASRGAGPGSLPPGFKPGSAFGHCGPDDHVPASAESHLTDYLPPGTPGGVYVGDICNWHDHCTAWTSYLHDGYNCDMLLRQALHARCAQVPQPNRARCDIAAEFYFLAVEKARHWYLPEGLDPNHGPPPPQVGYPPGVHH